ncbi:hypothetical protein B2J93_4849 [Marssonina coronariae]|uniref:BTB domain-containing protein n=1 Tax=Diplocarpon coronariae TaxID=2795749 RepID=A0A218ZGZ0_9HELO|nr:hypothetical protein JHW43_008685 [Diplocarpon mali]OWP07341.1 hypothetical protein B2J93_4849 [Marssonina coronariae]
MGKQPRDPRQGEASKYSTPKLQESLGSSAQTTPEARLQILRDLSDIARVANGPANINVQPRLSKLGEPRIFSGLNISNGQGPAGPFEFVATSQSDRSSHEISANHLPQREREQLRNRDSNAVQYTKSQLCEGDTLVIVHFPNQKPVYDATGFQLGDTHRVHSERLKAASPTFKNLLEDDWQQHRFKRRNRLVNKLPPGITYVLDLTPPEEGDEALDLTADLSCSLGIRRWYKAGFTECNVAHGMVGGEDETTTHPMDKSKAQSDGRSPVGAEPSQSTTVPTVSRVAGDGVEQGDLQATLEVSKKAFDNVVGQKSSAAAGDYTGREVLDYCPIRHRTGIERLLQVIEGKDPRLDSAPKVWTLAVLANYFKCPRVVVDYIVTWLIAEPNCKIFEILPEDCLRIGMLLENLAITRYAFTILVSEEALRVGTAKSGSDGAKESNASTKITRFGRNRESLDEDLLNSIQHAGRNFHARIEQEVKILLNPAMVWVENRPEFQKLVSIKDFIEAFADLSDVQLEEKRSVINIAIANIKHYVRGRILWCFFQSLDEAQVKNWNDRRWQEQHVVKGEFTQSIYSSLTGYERLMTRYLWSTMRMLRWEKNCAQCTTNLIYDDSLMTDITAEAHAAARELKILRVTINDLLHSTGRLNVLIMKSIMNGSYNDGILPTEGHQEVSTQSNLGIMKEAQKAVDPKSSFDEEEKPLFWQRALRARDETSSGVGPSKNVHYAPTPPNEAIRNPSKKRVSILVSSIGSNQSVKSLPSTDFDFKLKPLGLPSLPLYKTEPLTSSQPPVPADQDIGPLSPFLSLTTLFMQIDLHLSALISPILSRGEIEHPSLCDTLLCLSDHEYKYLPLWANGLDDGSGGVFETELPPAERGGPVGPGPGYHTGSTVNSSRASTELGFDDNAMSIFGGSNSTDNAHTSIGVEDGLSEDHVDRRRTLLESDFLTPTGSHLCSEDSYDRFSSCDVFRTQPDHRSEFGNHSMDLPIRGKGKGKAVQTSEPASADHASSSPAFRPVPNYTEDEYDEGAFYATGGDGEDGAYDFSCSDGDGTEIETENETDSETSSSSPDEGKGKQVF